MTELVKCLTFQTNEIRTVIDDATGEVRWVAADICKALGIKHTARAAARLSEGDVSFAHISDANNHKQKVSVVNEPGVYTLIIRSNSPLADPMIH